MNITILAFGIAREIVGSSATQVEVPEGTTPAMLVNVLRERYSGLQRLSSFAIAVNGQYAQPDVLIKVSDEIAIIPPVSGG